MTGASVIVLAGVAGVGKTTVGQRVAARLGCAFVDADDFHSAASVEKMRRGEPLTDADRAPWLAALNVSIREWLAAGRATVLACSALNGRSRATLREGTREGEVRFVLLDAPASVIARRLRERTGHYAGEALLASQLAALERPAPGEALVVDANGSLDAVAEAVLAALARR